MGLFDLLKNKISETELKIKIRKELQATTLKAIQKYKEHPNIELSLLKGAMDNLYRFPISNYESNICTDNEVYQSEIFQKLLKEEVNKVLEELVKCYKIENQITYSDEITLIPNNKNSPPKEIDTFILPKNIEYFIILEECEKAIKKGVVNTKEEEADYLVQLMEQEEKLIQEEKLCPKCHALNTVKNGHCYACNEDI